MPICRRMTLDQVFTIYYIHVRRDKTILHVWNCCQTQTKFKESKACHWDSLILFLTCLSLTGPAISPHIRHLPLSSSLFAEILLFSPTQIFSSWKYSVLRVHPSNSPKKTSILLIKGEGHLSVKAEWCIKRCKGLRFFPRVHLVLNEALNLDEFLMYEGETLVMSGMGMWRVVAHPNSFLHLPPSKHTHTHTHTHTSHITPNLHLRKVVKTGTTINLPQDHVNSGFGIYVTVFE